MPAMPLRQTGELCAKAPVVAISATRTLAEAASVLAIGVLAICVLMGVHLLHATSHPQNESPSAIVPHIPRFGESGHRPLVPAGRGHLPAGLHQFGVGLIATLI